ncbi:histidine kinase dimerization/phospho-acceptor domain-containing protein [Ruminococcus sp. HUN007]|uniref:sensor histidine kinase n=1 Tax=Ruminococcus sp. HUN007 TaxID=1514668 RepID=UPI0006797CA5|nr:histidine kinase dimerization/phospho-acceptor domain-containing protein [Ruminococcus sp. HUN007]
MFFMSDITAKKEKEEHENKMLVKEVQAEQALRIEQDRMINALSSDYRSVYHVDLDHNDAVCYRGDPEDDEQTREWIHFPFYERFKWYAEHSIDENFRNAFLEFLEPENIRNGLSKSPVISYCYLVHRKGKHYYEMIKIASVHPADETEDDTVHAVGLGLTDIDEDFRNTMMKNQALVEALEAAENANKAKTAFLSNMSHEIRTPMNAIIGLDRLALLKEDLDDETRNYLKKIGESASHLLELINDILDMSRIESGRMIIKKEEFSLYDILEQINTMVMSQCEDKGLEYRCRIKNNVAEYYIGDDMKLKTGTYQHSQ